MSSKLPPNYEGWSSKILKQMMKNYQSTEIKYFDFNIRSNYFKIHWIKKELYEQRRKKCNES